MAGNCRMCLVEMGLPAVDPATNGAPISGMRPRANRRSRAGSPRPTIGCATNASPGLHIRTTTPMVKECREGVMEFLLINHPLDCPICDQAGECSLQEHATGYVPRTGLRFSIEDKNVKPKRTQLAARHARRRALHHVLALRSLPPGGNPRRTTCSWLHRPAAVTRRSPAIPARNLSRTTIRLGRSVHICPVGALTSTDFRFKMRVWFLKQTDSINPESSVGCNTVVWSREGVIYRITPRSNDEVNDMWIARARPRIRRALVSRRWPSHRGKNRRWRRPGRRRL